jgi:hypothetical protein
MQLPQCVDFGRQLATRNATFTKRRRADIAKYRLGWKSVFTEAELPEQRFEEVQA